MVKALGLLWLIILLLAAGDCFAGTSDPLVDPMRPARTQVPVAVKPAVGGNSTQQPDTRAWRLTAVLTSVERSVAVINGNYLQKGDTLEGYRLVMIKPDKVVLQNRQGKLVLRRAGTGLKKLSANQDVTQGSKP